MSDDELFDAGKGTGSRGRVRRALELVVRERRRAGEPTDDDVVALLRTLADTIDRWARFVDRSPQAKAYDRIALATLIAQYDSTRSQLTSQETQGDAVDDLLQRLYAEESDTTGPVT